MNRNTPIATITDDARVVAAAIRRRVCATDGPVLAWTGNGEVYARPATTRSAQYAERHHPDAILGMYTRRIKVTDIEEDVREMQSGVVA